MKKKDNFYLNQAYLMAEQSKDNSTHVGAIIVGPDDEVRSTGYNSFPRNIKDNIEERFQKPEKYMWFAHAERNAIYNAARIGTSTKDCELYTNGVPCSGCAIAIIQSGIQRVIVDEDWTKEQTHWDDEAKRTRQMFHEAGVQLDEISFQPMRIRRYKRGKEY